VTIPARAHFCWIGSRLPWAYVFAILSAAERGGLDDIVLHHTDVLEAGAELRALTSAAGVRLSLIDPIELITQAGNPLGIATELTAIYRRLDSPVARTNVLRAALLYLQGGIYLDLDTITTDSLLPLLNVRQFVGCEYIVWPGFVRASRSPALWARSLALDLLRKPMRRVPHGWKLFRHVERFYFRGVNGAVLGAEAGSSLLSDYLRAMAAVPLERQTRPHALGTNLLQDVVSRYQSDDLVIEAPHVFYPLPPEISEHWFRIHRNVRLDAVLSTQTRVVHWYASVRTKSRVALIDPAYVRENQQHQLYSALVCANIRNLPETA